MPGTLEKNGAGILYLFNCDLPGAACIFPSPGNHPGAGSMGEGGEYSEGAGFCPWAFPFSRGRSAAFQGKFPDFVRGQCSAIGLLGEAGMRLVRASERAFSLSRERALQQIGRHSGAVEKCLTAPAGMPVLATMPAQAMASSRALWWWKAIPKRPAMASRAWEGISGKSLRLTRRLST